ncbi:hypothetical protein [Streptomyces sp. NPDC088789]|uniref:hypothetical protein n=1 Tax=Streptomyces sp. NPDC088789 TaxID=3365899 RepID=UPI0037F23F09
MATTETVTPPDALALVACPPLDALSVDQARGATCVWDATEPPLTAETAVDLGERRGDVHWFPRACREHTGERAHEALLDHVPACEECTEHRAICAIGRALYRLARRRAV